MKPRYWPEGLLFIKTELDAELMFSSIALDSNNEERTARNTANARHAHDTAQRHVRELLLRPEDSNQLDGQFSRLKADLLRLGERF